MSRKDAIQILRQAIDVEEFDYRFALSCLADYRKPRDKLSHLIARGDIIRVKKGLYVFGEQHRRGPICMESLSNLIFGPSYPSLHYALAFYGLIPERVEQVTAVTPKRSKEFETPLGVFSYAHLPLKAYAVGMTLVQVDSLHNVLMATPEKALVDLMVRQKGLHTSSDVADYLLDDLRIEKERVAQLNINRLREIQVAYGKEVLKILTRWVQQLRCE